MALNLVYPNDTAYTDTLSIVTGSGHPGYTLMEDASSSDSMLGNARMVDERGSRIEPDVGN